MAMTYQNTGQQKLPANWMVLIMLLFSGIYAGINAQFQSNTVFSIYNIPNYVFQVQLCYYAGFAVGGAISAVPITIFGHKKPIIAGIGIELILDIILSIAPGNISALIFTQRIMIAIIQGILYCAASRWSISLVNKRERGYILVYFIVAQEFGGLVTVILSSAQKHYLFQVATILLGIIIIVLSILTPDYNIINRDMDIFNNIGYLKSNKQFFNCTNLIMIFISGLLQTTSAFPTLAGSSNKLFYPYEATRHYGIYITQCIGFISSMIPFSMINWLGRKKCFQVGESLSILGLIYLMILYFSLTFQGIMYPSLLSLVSGTMILTIGYFTGGIVYFQVCIAELLFDAWSVGLTVFMANVYQMIMQLIYSACEYNLGVYYIIMLILHLICYFISQLVIIDAENCTLEEIQTKIHFNGSLDALKSKLIFIFRRNNSINQQKQKATATSHRPIHFDDDSDEECDLLHGNNVG